MSVHPVMIGLVIKLRKGVISKLHVKEKGKKALCCIIHYYLAFFNNIFFYKEQKERNVYENTLWVCVCAVKTQLFDIRKKCLNDDIWLYVFSLLVLYTPSVKV